MSRARDIFRSNNALIQKYGQDAAPEAPSSGNVRFGSEADILRHTQLRPLSGVKRTPNVRFQEPMRFSAGNVCFRG